MTDKPMTPDKTSAPTAEQIPISPFGAMPPGCEENDEPMTTPNQAEAERVARETWMAIPPELRALIPVAFADIVVSRFAAALLAAKEQERKESAELLREAKRLIADAPTQWNGTHRTGCHALTKVFPNNECNCGHEKWKMDIRAFLSNPKVQEIGGKG